MSFPLHLLLILSFLDLFLCQSYNCFFRLNAEEDRAGREDGQSLKLEPEVQGLKSETQSLKSENPDHESVAEHSERGETTSLKSQESRSEGSVR